MTETIMKVTRHEHWVRVPEGPYNSEGWLDASYWLDEIGNEYNSLDHVLVCAVARGIGLVV